MHHHTFWHDNHECRPDIRDAIAERLNAMVHRFARTFVVRLDVRFPRAYRSTGTSWEVSKLMKRLVEIYAANPSDPSRRATVHYVVAREQGESCNPHYHLALMFDGSKVDNGWTVQSHAEAVWARIVGEAATGCVHLCDSHLGRHDGIKIQNPRKESTDRVLEAEQAAFHHAHSSVVTWLMYLAKTDTKGSAPLRSKEFFCSMLP
jgi:protein GP2